MNEILKKAKFNMVEKEKILSKYAFKSKDAINIREESEDIRPAFFRDTDKIIHSLSYTRYINKTQVYSFEKNDHITYRALHVQLVSKIAKTIGRALKLNEDLIEATALGHDIGHSPFGHTGEKLLDEICRREKIGYFCHNAQSVRLLKDIENINITIQTLDGILAHNGEILLEKYEYNPKKTQKELFKEVEGVFLKENYNSKIIPMTLEGCVVKISDVIAYVGRDIEDAITVNCIKREDLPEQLTNILGNTNSKIINTLILDLIENSYGKQYLMFSKNIFFALKQLLDWNYKNIYNSEQAKKDTKKLELLFNYAFDRYMNKLKDFNIIDKIKIKENMNFSDRNFYEFINQKTESYKKETNKKRIVIDYIAGQTDKFFLNENKFFNF